MGYTDGKGVRMALRLGDLARGPRVGIREGGIHKRLMAG
jgi:hypothetical protein